MITLEVSARAVILNRHQQGLATGATARSALQPIFRKALASQLAYAPPSRVELSETTLGRMIVKYSEQLVFKPLIELQHWFTYASGVTVEEGYPPLYYSRTKNVTISPNKSAVSAIGEGVAGFLAQRRYHCRKLARPNHDYPDIVMESGNATYLVEAKATLRGEDRFADLLNDELARFVCFLASCRQMDARPVVGLLIGTMLDSETMYTAFITEVTLL